MDERLDYNNGHKVGVCPAPQPPTAAAALTVPGPVVSLPVGSDGHQTQRPRVRPRVRADQREAPPLVPAGARALAGIREQRGDEGSYLRCDGERPIHEARADPRSSSSSSSSSGFKLAPALF